MCEFFFFKQKTAYEVRISDWSSDVCSADLHMLDDQVEQRGEVLARAFQAVVGPAAAARGEHAGEVELVFAGVQRGEQVEDLGMDFDRAGVLEIGRASCRESGCQSV